MRKDILQTIKHLRTHKTLGPDKIPNEILKIIAPEIICHLEQIFNDSLPTGHPSLHFKEPTTIILRNLGGTRGYTDPKRYRPTIRRIMEAVPVTRISHMATTHNLLLKTHSRGRHGLDVETAIQYLLENIYAAWTKNQIASRIFFNDRLLYHLLKEST